jgi:type VI protein secretion system component Hcp
MFSTDLTFMRIASVDGEEPYNSTMKLIRIAGFKHALAIPMSPARASLGAQSTLRRQYCEHGEFTVFKGLDKTSCKICVHALRLCRILPSTCVAAMRPAAP